MTDLFQRLAKQGYGPDLLPIMPPGVKIAAESNVRPENRGKVPGVYVPAQQAWKALYNWSERSADAADWKSWSAFPAVNTGLQTRRTPVIDIDTDDAELAATIEATALRILGPAPVRSRGGARRALFYRSKTGYPKHKLPWLKGETKGHVEMLGIGQQIVIYGRHASGTDYQWHEGRGLAETPYDALTEIGTDALARFFEEVRLLLELDDAEVGSIASGKDAARHPIGDPRLIGDPEEIYAALEALPNDLDYDGWVAMTAAIKGALGGQEPDGLEAYVTWALKYPGNTREMAEAKWHSIKETSLGAEEVLRAAARHGFTRKLFDPIPPLPEDVNVETGKVPTIIIKKSQHAKQVDDILAAALENHGREMLCYGGQWAYIELIGPNTTLQLLTDRAIRKPVIKLHEYETLLYQICRRVIFQQWKKSGKKDEDTKEPIFELVDVEPPRDIIRTLFAAGAQRAPVLTRIATYPPLLPDGKTVRTPGYDAATGVYLHVEHNGLLNLPQASSKEQAEKAYDWLSTAFLDEFPFATPLHRDRAIAALLTLLSRHLLKGGAPAFAINAPDVQSGKTTLAKMIIAGAYGYEVVEDGFSPDSEEMIKKIVGWLSEGRETILIDNVPDGQQVGSPELAKCLTGDEYSGRLLGSNTIGTFPLQQTWFFTGNNLSFKDDLPSRVLNIRLTPDASGEAREFRRTYPVAWAIENRIQIIKAAYAILQGYIQAGSPEMGGVPTRFRAWGRLVRDGLMWAGGTDVAHGDATTDAAALDETGESVADFFRALADYFGDREFTIEETRKSLRDMNPQARIIEEAWRDLPQRGLPTGVKAKITRVFCRYQDRWLAGFRLRASEKATVDKAEVLRWQLDRR